MQAIIELNGGQLWIEHNLIFKIEKINKKKGSFFLLNKILFFKNNNQIYVGQPFLKLVNLQILCIVLKQQFLNKIVVYKMKSKKKYRKKLGYTHYFTYLYPIFLYK